jgi:hypothetical protein
MTLGIKPFTQPSIASRLLNLNPQSLVGFKIVEKRYWRKVLQNNYTLTAKSPNYSTGHHIKQVFNMMKYFSYL